MLDLLVPCVVGLQDDNNFLLRVSFHTKGMRLSINKDYDRTAQSGFIRITSRSCEWKNAAQPVSTLKLMDWDMSVAHEPNGGSLVIF
jgi:hypothetical protein